MKLNFQSKLLTEKQSEMLARHKQGLPDSFFKDLMNDQLGRDYLNRLSSADKWHFSEVEHVVRNN